MHIAFLVFFLLFADFAQSQASPSKKKQVSNACKNNDIFRQEIVLDKKSIYEEQGYILTVY